MIQTTLPWTYASRVTALTSEPIEQNVQGSQGMYELLYFMRESRTLTQYMKQARKESTLVESKTHDERDKLVR